MKEFLLACIKTVATILTAEANALVCPDMACQPRGGSDWSVSNENAEPHSD